LGIRGAADVYARGETGALTACGANHEELGVLQYGETFEIEIQHLGKLSLDVVDPLKADLSSAHLYGSVVKEFRRGETPTFSR
jgi:hypothetical protein